jgi:transaldolase
MWYDNIARDLLDSGALQKLIDQGIRGLTSNPSIFASAIGGSAIYDAQIQSVLQETETTKQVYEELAVADIRRAADLLRPVYDGSGGTDGFVSLEVSPLLAHDTAGTIEEALRLFRWVDRPNLMVKIPATPAGIPAIEGTLAQGLNINVTLIFSREMYRQVMQAYLKGLQRYAASGGDISRVASVASFFVSRVDTLVDEWIDNRIAAEPDRAGHLAALKGKAAVANARLAYQLFKQTFGGEPFAALAAQGAHVQRPLWASTSTKNPAYPDLIYVDTLIGPHTVNTAPPHTIDAFIDHGTVALTVEDDLDEAQAVMDALEEAGSSMEAVTSELLDDGVEKFTRSFEALLAALEERCAALAS